jgi:hypothetical protein
MSLSTDVNLPRSHAPQFPDRCVVCGANEPKSTVTLLTGTQGWWTWILWTFGWPLIVKAPACRWCGWRLHIGRLCGLILTIAITLAAIWYVWPHMSAFVPRSIKIWAQAGLALTCLLPYILYQVFFPRPFDITAFSDSVDYSFRDRKAAFTFAISNSDAAWTKVDGVPIAQLMVQLLLENAARKEEAEPS